MKAKEYLLQLQWLDTAIKQKNEELKDLQRQVKGIKGFDYSKERVQSSHSAEAPFVKPISRIIDLEAEINNEILEFVSKKHKIINQIQGLKNKQHLEILYEHYVKFKALKNLAAEMNFTYQYVVELHGGALKDFQTTYENLLKTYQIPIEYL